MRLKVTGLAVALAVAASGAMASTLSFGFDSGLEGWRSITGTHSYSATGGNGGGYIQSTDAAQTRISIRTGRRVLGDLNVFNGGTFSFDAKMIENRRPTIGSGDARFGRVILVGGGRRIGVDMWNGAPTGDWQNASISLDAATWGVSESLWNRVFSDFRGIVLVTDGWRSRHEVTGIDNITFTAPTQGNRSALVAVAAVPVPATGLLLLGGLGVFAAASRRRSRT